MSALPASRRSLATFAVVAVVVVAGGTAAAAAPPPVGEIRAASASGAIPGSYLVVLKSDVVKSDVVKSDVPHSDVSGSLGPGGVEQAVADRAAALSRRYGGTVRDVYGAALTGFSARMSATQAERLAADPAVAFVEQDQLVTALATQLNPPWGLDRIDQRNLPLSGTYTYPNTASNVRAYIIDTGIRLTHTQFGGRATWGTNTAGGANTDCNGHGTHLAGIVGGSTYGVAKQVRLVAVKVLSCSGSGSISGVVSGVNWVTANAIKPAVANMSLGGGPSAALDTAVTNSINSGITYAVTAGSSNSSACNFSPARVGPALTVSASTQADAKASFANFGPCVDLFAPGVSIPSAWYLSDTATATLSGTSMATAHVTGAAALVASANPTWTPGQVSNFLITNSTKGVLTGIGTGSPNRLLFVVN